MAKMKKMEVCELTSVNSLALVISEFIGKKVFGLGFSFNTNFSCRNVTMIYCGPIQFLESCNVHFNNTNYMFLKILSCIIRCK